MGWGLHCQMQTCLTGEVRGSKRRDFERSFLEGARAPWRGRNQNPEGENLERARAAPLVFFPLLPFANFGF